MSGSTISGTITNTVTVGSAGYGSPLTITNTGEINAPAYAAGVDSGAGNQTLLNDGTIIGYDGVEFGGGLLVNNGFIAANGISGQGIFLGSGSLVNNGTIESSGHYATQGVSGVEAETAYVYNGPTGLIQGGVFVYSSIFVDAGRVTPTYHNGVKGQIAIYVGGLTGVRGAATLELLPGAVIDGEIKAYQQEELILGGSGGSAVRVGTGSSIIGFGAIHFAAGAARAVESANAGRYSITGFAAGDALILDSFVAASATLVSGVGIILHDDYFHAETITLSGTFGAGSTDPITGTEDVINISANGGKTTLSVQPMVIGPVSAITTSVAGPVVLGNGHYAASLTITNTGSVIAAGTDGEVGLTADTTGATLLNDGLVEGGAGGAVAGGYGVSLAGGAQLFNTGSILGGAYGGGGLYLAYGTAGNAGLIEGAAGITLGGAGAHLVGNVTIVNTTSGVIHGGDAARGGAGASIGVSTTPDQQASTIINNGHIHGGASSHYKGGAGLLLTGPAFVINNAAGVVHGANGVRGGAGIDARTSSSAVIINRGIIRGGSGSAGPDGAGIQAGDNVLIVDSGLIAGGGNGKADAIDLQNGQLAVLPGASFIGTVVGAGYARLTLEGTAATPLGGFGTEFQGFNQIYFYQGAARSLEGAAAAFVGENIQHFALGDGIILDGFNATSETLLDHHSSGYGYTDARIALSDGVNTVSLNIGGSFGPEAENRLQITDANGNTTISLMPAGYQLPITVYPLNSMYKSPITLGSAGDPITDFSVTSIGTVFPYPASHGANAISGDETGITLRNAGELRGEYASYSDYFSFGHEIVVELGPPGDGVSLTGASVINTGIILGGEGPAAGNHGAGIDLTASTAANSGLVEGGATERAYKGASVFSIPGTAAPGAALAGGYLLNSGTLLGGAGGLFNAYTYTAGGTVTITGEHGGAGLALSAGGIVDNTAHGVILGGLGGAAFGFSGYYPPGSKGGAGGVGAFISGATLINAGRITGGGGAGPDFGQAGHQGAQGIGAVIENGLLINSGTITGADAVRFSGAGTLELEPGATFIGAVVAQAGAGDVLELAAATVTGTLDMEGSFSEFDTIAFDPAAAWLLGGTVAEFAANQTISGFAQGDTIMLDGFTASGGSFIAGTGLVVNSLGGGDITLDITGSFASHEFTFITSSAGTEIVICYLRGTGIATPSGDVNVENLRIGDPVLTRFGGVQPVKWIGQQGFAKQFLKGNRDMLPVCITAGALGAGLPVRDLFVSPGHSILLGGTLVLARHLVNGVTITQIWAPDEVHYFSIELPAHDCVKAAGVWAETYADCPGLRAKHHNAASFIDLYPGHVAPAEPQLCAPRPLRGPHLAAALAPVLALAAEETSPGCLEGYLEVIGPEGILIGWARDEANPELPVLLEILRGGVVIGSVLANEMRSDLEEAGIGTGRCGFIWTPSGAKSALDNLTLRHAVTHAHLPLCHRLQSGVAA